MVSASQQKALQEIVNRGMKRAAAALNEMLESHIELEVPSIALFGGEQLKVDLQGLTGVRLSCVQLGFHGSFRGAAALVFPPQSAVALVSALTGEDPDTPSLNAVMAGTLNEVGNIVINGVIGTVGNILPRPFDFSLPNYLEGDLPELLQATSHIDKATILLTRTHFQVQEQHIEGNIFLIFELGSLHTLLTAIDRISSH